MTSEPPQETPPNLRTPATNDFPKGPEVGERLPDFTLMDQHGAPVNFTAARGGQRALVVFHRSVRWWPYCRTQLVQLQQNLEAFTAAGIRVFAISYDPVEALATFAQEFGITYPLLYDQNSVVIQRFGILNTLIRPDEAVYGIPYPGVYAVDEEGVVAEKAFYRYYRTRPSAQSVLKDLFAVDFDTGSDPHAEAEGPGAAISAVLAADALTFMQRVPLYVRIDLDPGLHIYRAPVPEGFMATEVTVTGPEGLVLEPAIFPAAHPFRVEGLPHEFQVMDGRVEVEVPLMWGVDEGSTVPVDVSVRYQGCDDRQCFIPRAVSFHLDLPVGRLYRPVRR